MSTAFLLYDLSCFPRLKPLQSLQTSSLSGSKSTSPAFRGSWTHGRDRGRYNAHQQEPGKQWDREPHTLPSPLRAPSFLSHTPLFPHVPCELLEGGGCISPISALPCPAQGPLPSFGPPVRELDPTWQRGSKTPHTATKTQCSLMNKYFKKKKECSRAKATHSYSFWKSKRGSGRVLNQRQAGRIRP